MQIIKTKYFKMKKIALLMIGVVLGFSLSAQTTTPQTAESLLKAKEKSDADIKNPKKAAKMATWLKRGNIYLDLLQFNIKGLWVGMPTEGLSGAELIVGKPQKIVTQGNKEDWIYDRITLHFVDKKLESWDETKPLVENGEDVAMEAYLKAWELDEKGKLKSNETFLANLATLRGMFASKGVEYYNKAEKSKDPEMFKKSVAELDKALKLGQFPKNEADSLFDPGLVAYYAGVIAQTGKQYDLAEKYYQMCIEKNWQEDKAYNSLAAVCAEQDKHDEELKILQEGFDKYQDSKLLLLSFINYYLRTGESEKALEKLQKGIKDNPDNQSYYYAIGTLYDAMVLDTTDKYTKEQKEEYEQLAIDNYKKAIEIKDDYFDAIYNLGVLYYNKGVYILKAAQDIPPSQNDKYEAEKQKAINFFKMALPYMEKAHEINYRDRNTILSLSTIYLKLQMYDKQKEMKELLDSLPEENSPLDN